LAQGKGQATTAATTPIGMYQAIKSLCYLSYERSLLYAEDTHLLFNSFVFLVTPHLLEGRIY
jgi:hypothetical protein